MNRSNDLNLLHKTNDGSLWRRLFEALGDTSSAFVNNPSSYLKSLSSGTDDYLLSRLVKQLSFAGSLISRDPSFYLRSSLPDRVSTILPFRLADQFGTAVRMLISHPFHFLKNAFSGDQIGKHRRRKLRVVLAVSFAIHSFLIVYLIYLAIFAPFANLRVVNRPYAQFDPNEVLQKLYYPPGLLRIGPTHSTLSIEEIKERDRKRREEAAKKEAEKRKREELEKKKAEEAAAKAAKESKSASEEPPPGEFGVINEAPIKDAIGKVYTMYQSGQLDLNANDLSIMCSFRIAPSGSIPRDSIKLLKSSGNKTVDATGLEVLWLLGESNALGPLSVLSSNTIRLDMSETSVRLTITGFAPNVDEAELIRDKLNILLKGARLMQKNSDSMELLAMLKVTSDQKRVDADLNLSRARASEMMRARFNKPTQ